MNSAQFDQVSVIKKANVYFNGRCISHTIQFEDGTKKTLGVIMKTDQPLEFQTHVAERMEIISGECRVKIAGNDEFEKYSEGQSFIVSGQSSFALETDDVLDYVCHYEG